MNLTTPMHLLLMLRMSGATPQLPHLPVWHAKGKTALYLFNFDTGKFCLSINTVQLTEHLYDGEIIYQKTGCCFE
jgi:hypothetical protein